MTKTATAGVTPSGQSLDGAVWDIPGQTYKPVQHSAASFAFDPPFPPGTFVPPQGFTTLDTVIAKDELAAIGGQYAAMAGFSVAG